MNRFNVATCAMVAVMACTSSVLAGTYAVQSGGSILDGDNFFFLDVNGEGTSLLSVELQLSLTHDALTDVNVVLISPVGTAVTLFTTLPPPDPVYFEDVIFSDVPAAPRIAGSTTLEGGILRYRGEFRPEDIGQSMSAFVGENPNTDGANRWTLRIFDSQSGLFGNLLSPGSGAPWNPQGLTAGTQLIITSNGVQTVVPEPVTLGLAVMSLTGVGLATLRRRHG
ncbi:MAG: proprotein convertase P-domain-containing protein [Phycisphaeraceae bacterium]